MEPHLGFVHSVQYPKPSLVCDFMELYRHSIDNFVIDYYEKLQSKDFKAREETFSGKKAKRVYLRKSLNDDFIDKIHEYFKRTVRVPRVKKWGDKQELETLINEEDLLLAKYLRKEREELESQNSNLVN